MIGYQIKHKFNIVQEASLRVDIVIEDCEKSADLVNKCLDFSFNVKPENTTDSNGNTILKHQAFPSTLRFRLKHGDLQSYMANISNFSFMTTVVIIMSFFSMLSTIKKATENHALA